MRMKDYREELREYKEKYTDIGLIRTRIQGSVARTNLHYAFHKNSIHDILIYLKQRFAPNDETRERDLELQYEAHGKPPEDWNVETSIALNVANKSAARSVWLPVARVKVVNRDLIVT
jgi:hypothetical protein